MKEIETADVQELFDWLQGKKAIDGMEFVENPKLSKEAAFSVIYYLQERLGVLEDKYEVCRKCGDIYDSDIEGTCIDEDYPAEMHGCYCDQCRPD